MQDYDFKARFESTRFYDSTRHSRATDEGMTPRVLTFGLPAVAQEQDRHSKPKKPKTN
jgi:hypothetical protein